MNKDSKRRLLGYLVVALLTLATVKLIWVLVEFVWLPTEGVEINQGPNIKPLPRSYRLVSNRALPKAPKIKPPKHATSTIRNMKLLATYLGPRRHLAVIRKGGSAHVFKEGESISGYQIQRIEERKVWLEHNGQSALLEIAKRKESDRATPFSAVTLEPVPRREEQIRQEGNTRLIPRSLISRYSQEMDKIAREIVLVPYKRDGQLRGFRIRYIKSGSLMSKLGLRAGDIITAINGEAIRDYSIPMQLLQSADTLEGLILKIKRGEESLELEYEVR